MPGVPFSRDERATTARTVWKVLALAIPAFAVVAFLVGVVGFGLLGIGQAPPPPMDDLRVSNHADVNHTVRIAVIPTESAPAEDPTNESSETDSFEVAAELSPGETVTFDGVAAEDAQYRFVVTVDDREPQSFERRGPDDYCQLSVAVASGGAVEVGMGCA